MSAGKQEQVTGVPVEIDGPDGNTPLLIMTVDVGAGRHDTITIFPGDRPEALAKAFAAKHGLKKAVIKQLEDLISRKKADASKFSTSRMSFSRASTSRLGTSQSADRVPGRSLSALKPAAQGQSRPSNYGEWMYQREQKARDQRRLDQMRTSSFRDLQASPKPKVVRPRSASESTELVLLQRGEATQQKIKNLRSKAMEEEMQECTFRPAVNDRSDRIDRSASSGRGQPRFEKLFGDAYEKELRQYDRLETAVKTEFPFHPETISTRKAPESQSAMVKRLMSSKKNFENVISKLKEELEAGAEQSSTFKPITGRGPTTAKYERRGPVHEHLYEQRTHKQAVVQKLRDQDAVQRAVQPKLAIPRSEELAAESRKRQLEALFMRIDHDQDGLIAFATLTLDDIDPRAVQLLSPIWTELAQSESTMDLPQFLGYTEQMMKSMSNEEKNFLLRTAVKQEENVQPQSAQPLISKNSEELASRRRELLGADIYARRMVEKTITSERLKGLKQQLAHEEMRECTFRPAVINYKRP